MRARWDQEAAGRRMHGCKGLVHGARTSTDSARPESCMHVRLRSPPGIVALQLAPARPPVTVIVGQGVGHAATLAVAHLLTLAIV